MEFDVPDVAPILCFAFLATVFYVLTSRNYLYAFLLSLHVVLLHNTLPPFYASDLRGAAHLKQFIYLHCDYDHSETVRTEETLYANVRQKPWRRW